MKKKDISDLRTKKLEDLLKLVSDKKKEIGKVALKIKSGEEKNLKKVKNLKLEVARILTIVKEKEIIEIKTAKETKKE